MYSRSLLFFAALFSAAGVLAQPSGNGPVAGELFPQALAVEHQLIERELDGTVFYGEPVRDTYGGSWIVSERPDGSRLVIDLVRREMTEIRPAEGIYWSIGFEAFANLRGKIVRLEGSEPERNPGVVARAAAPEPELELVELQGAVALRSGTPAASMEQEVRRFAVKPKGNEKFVAEVWVDPRFRFSEAAQVALESFERNALGNPGSGDPLEAGKLMASVRRQTSGALPVLTVLPVYRAARAEAPGEKVGEREDRVLKTARLEAFPAELVQVPEGLLRVSHPLESILVALEAQAEVDAALAGKKAVKE